MFLILSKACKFVSIVDHSTQVIKDYQLIAIVLILVLVDVIVLSVWKIVDPLYLKIQQNPLEQYVSGHQEHKCVR